MRVDLSKAKETIDQLSAALDELHGQEIPRWTNSTNSRETAKDLAALKRQLQHAQYLANHAAILIEGGYWQVRELGEARTGDR